MSQILVPTDLSDLSLSVLGLAKRLGSVVALHVIKPGDTSESAPAEAARRAQAHSSLRRALELHQAADVTPRIALGRPGPRIAGWAQDFPIDLIVLSSHGRTGLRHVLMGSVAEKVLAHAHRPILICQGPKVASALAEADPVRALVAIDVAEGGRGLLLEALPWLRTLRANTTLCASVPGRDPEDARRARLELDALQLEIPSDMRGQVEVLEGSARASLVEVAADSDLLVLGHHGRTGLERLLLGSITESVMRHCAATLIVPVYTGL